MAANLKFLYADDNRIADLTPLAALTSLQELRLENNPVTDWSPVAHLDYVAGRPGETTVYG
jgi:Leucine-rich repeat (LRR) protein